MLDIVIGYLLVINNGIIICWGAYPINYTIQPGSYYNVTINLPITYIGYIVPNWTKIYNNAHWGQFDASIQVVNGSQMNIVCWGNSTTTYGTINLYFTTIGY